MASSSKKQKASPARIIIDTDPGVDDALAILLAFGAKSSIVVEGLTIVCGNGSDIKKLGANAKFLSRLAGYPNVPVSLGDAPLDDGAGEIPNHVHGEDGLGNVATELGRTVADFSGFHSKLAAQFIADTCAAAPGEITLVCIGPLSNLAAALALRPDLPQLVREVVIMGGAVHGELRGNRAPAAEANFISDPEAAQAVLTAGFRSVILADLGITHQTDVCTLREACCKALGSESAMASTICKFTQAFVDCYLKTFGAPTAPAHDVVAVMYLIRPELFTKKSARVEVELQGTLTRGMSVADWKGKWGKPPNCEVLMTVDAEQFNAEFVAAMRSLPAMMPPPLKHIDKLALVHVRDRKQLVVRSVGKSAFFTPGGKREAGESDVQALVRECKEELSVDLKVSSIEPFGVFRAQAHGKPEGTMVIMTCYTAEFDGHLAAANEIDELRWIGSAEAASVSATSALILQDLKAKGLID